MLERVVGAQLERGGAEEGSLKVVALVVSLKAAEELTRKDVQGAGACALRSR